MIALIDLLAHFEFIVRGDAAHDLPHAACAGRGDFVAQAALGYGQVFEVFWYAVRLEYRLNGREVFIRIFNVEHGSRMPVGIHQELAVEAFAHVEVIHGQGFAGEVEGAVEVNRFDDLGDAVVGLLPAAGFAFLPGVGGKNGDAQESGHGQGVITQCFGHVSWIFSR